ncbi:MAG: flagellar export chaperone FlgN [Angelakisella sp.]
MNDEDSKKAFYGFLTEYADFFRGMADFEEQKLGILLENKLTEIERAIAVTQANAMQLDNLEKKRIRLQGAAGLAELSLSELAESAPESSRGELRTLMEQLNQYIGDIKFYNTKSMNLVQTRLKIQEHTASHAAPIEQPSKLETNA